MRVKDRGGLYLVPNFVTLQNLLAVYCHTTCAYVEAPNTWKLWVVRGTCSVELRPNSMIYSAPCHARFVGHANMAAVTWQRSAWRTGPPVSVNHCSASAWKLINWDWCTGTREMRRAYYCACVKHGFLSAAQKVANMWSILDPVLLDLSQLP